MRTPEGLASGEAESSVSTLFLIPPNKQAMCKKGVRCCQRKELGSWQG